jgi:hypothetical protein
VTAIRLMFTGIPDSGVLPIGRLVLTALVLSSLAALKITFLIYACLFLGFWSLLMLWRNGVGVIVGQVLPLTLFVALFTMPWIIQQYLSSGTPLFGILGQGYYFSNHGFPFHPRGDTTAFRLRYMLGYVTRGWTVAPFVTLIATGVLFFRSPGSRSQALLAASLAGVFGSLLICFQISEVSVPRYTVSMLYISCLLPGLVGLILAVRGDRLGLVLGCAFILFLGSQWQDGKLHNARRLWAREHGQTLAAPGYADKIRHVQSLTEPGKRILATVTRAYLFDYRRNPIWNCDIPGAVSPPPGLPLTRDWKELEMFLDGKSTVLPPAGPVAEIRDFLVRSGVDYVLFERDPRVVYFLDSDVPVEPSYTRVLYRLARYTYKNFMNLARDRHAVFDDGNLILLDLRERRLPDDPPFVDFGVSEKRPEFLGKRAILFDPENEL